MITLFQRHQPFLIRFLKKNQLSEAKNFFHASCDEWMTISLSGNKTYPPHASFFSQAKPPGDH
jgi:hypothetical protein